MEWIIEISHSAKTIVLHESQEKTMKIQENLEIIDQVKDVYLKIVDKDGTLHWLSKNFIKNSCVSFREKKNNNLEQLASLT